MPCRRPLAVVGVAALLLAGCSSYGGSAPPTWVPSPARVNGGGEQASPIVPLPSPPGRGGGGPGSGGPGGGGSGSPSPSATDGRRIDPNVVATHLTAPVGLAMLPDGTALVGERTTGRILRVHPRAGQPVPTVRTLRGLDARGDGGLLDLAISPGYAEDGLIYAYVTTRTDNRVVEFTLHGPVTAVFTGIPKGRTGNTGRITFGAGGDLYVGTGDAGQPRLAARPTSLAGKVLRLDDIGDPAPGNPIPDSPVWTSGHEIVNGLCGVPHTHWVLDVEAGAGDEVNLLSGGSAYGFPAASPGTKPPIAVLPGTYRAPGGCTVLDGRLWVTSRDGQALLFAQLRASSSMLQAGRFSAVLKHRYGRLLTVVAADDGALWLTTSNRDGHGRPVAADERVIRYLPPASPAGSPV
jgi:glucose/arabinose dehydrogenase